MNRKLRVGVVFGGRSGEHEISLVSARSILAALDRERYDVVEIGIDSAGRWLPGPDAMARLTAAEPTGSGETTLASFENTRALNGLDIVFPVLHGTMGEDGTIQGFFELAGVPYVGSGVAASALGMDKALMKAVFEREGIPLPAWQSVRRSELEADPVTVRRRLVEALGLPLFVKPANLGSSVGISKAHDARELDAALSFAAEFDRKIVVEAAIDARELECAVLGNDEPRASVLGEIVPHREFYDFDAKYLDPSTELIIPAPLDAVTGRAAQQLALRAFAALDCAGMARVDFLLDRGSGQLYVSEVNTIPGFTSISMYPKLWEASGLDYPSLLDELIRLGLERAHDRARNRTWRLSAGGA